MGAQGVLHLLPQAQGHSIVPTNCQDEHHYTNSYSWLMVWIYLILVQLLRATCCSEEHVQK